MKLALVAALLFSTPLLFAADPAPAPAPAAPVEENPAAMAEREALRAEIQTELAQTEMALEASPKSLSLLSSAGDAHLFLGHFDKAVELFRRMIEVEPAQESKHWRLGIALFFAHQWAPSSQQFLKYHSYDDDDRENGIWKFLADAKGSGMERARAEMLEYKRFDREPFPALYELYAGRLTPEKFTADLSARNLTDDPRVMFFAHYYSGLFEDLLGHHEAALQSVRAAVALFTPQSAGSTGPGYMWQVARVHYDLLRAAP